MDRLFLREKLAEPEFSIRERVKIGVVGAAPGTGTSFIATSIAKAISLDRKRRVTFAEIFFEENEKERGCKTGGGRQAVCAAGKEYVENPLCLPRKVYPSNKRLLYDSLGMDKRFEGREFICFYKRLKDREGIKGIANVDERINWVLPTPYDVKESRYLSPIEALHLVNNVSGDVVICDLPGGERLENGMNREDSPGLIDILNDMDILVCVIDPLPSRLLAGESFVNELKKAVDMGMKVIWVLNRYNSGINDRELKDFLRIRDYIQIPMVSGELIYNAEYTCRVPYSVQEINKSVKEGIEKIVLRHKIFT